MGSQGFLACATAAIRWAVDRSPHGAGQGVRYELCEAVCIFVQYHRNTITSANDYFVKAAEVGSGQPNKADKLIRNIFGASVRGPIQKNRLFFFVNYEGTRRREEDSTVRTIPSPALRDGVLPYQ